MRKKTHNNEKDTDSDHQTPLWRILSDSIDNNTKNVRREREKEKDVWREIQLFCNMSFTLSWRENMRYIFRRFYFTWWMHNKFSYSRWDLMFLVKCIPLGCLVEIWCVLCWMKCIFLLGCSIEIWCFLCWVKCIPCVVVGESVVWNASLYSVWLVPPYLSKQKFIALHPFQ